jgi:DNA-binding response OmpR family regulator
MMDEIRTLLSTVLAYGELAVDLSEAASGPEALAVLDAVPVDLVLLDVMMPGRSGYDVCRELRASPQLSGVKVVMLSAKGAQADVGKGLQAGANLYITKPFSNRDLVDKIRALLGG